MIKNKELELTDVLELAYSIKPILQKHDVDPELHFSIIDDIAFEVSNMIDDKMGTCIHENIIPAMESIALDFSRDRPTDFCVAFLEIIMGKGKKFEANILKGQLDSEERLAENIEMALYIRDIDEIDKNIDIEGRFKKLIDKKKGIKELRFQHVRDMDADKWLSVNLSESDYGAFEESIDGIKQCIHAVLDSWV